MFIFLFVIKFNLSAQPSLLDSYANFPTYAKLNQCYVTCFDRTKVQNDSLADIASQLEWKSSKPSYLKEYSRHIQIG